MWVVLGAVIFHNFFKIFNIFFGYSNPKAFQVNPIFTLINLTFDPPRIVAFLHSRSWYQVTRSTDIFIQCFGFSPVWRRWRGGGQCSRVKTSPNEMFEFNWLSSCVFVWVCTICVDGTNANFCVVAYRLTCEGPLVFGYISNTLSSSVRGLYCLEKRFLENYFFCSQCFFCA